MVAAVLNLHIGSRPAAEALDEMSGGFRDRHDVVDDDTLGAADAEAGEGGSLHLVVVADHMVDFRHVREAGRIDLRRAARDHDLCVRPRPPRLPDRLPRLPHGFRRHRAGVHDHRVGEARGARMLAHDLRFIGVQPAAEGDDVDIRHGWRLSTKNGPQRGSGRGGTPVQPWIPACAGMSGRWL